MLFKHGSTQISKPDTNTLMSTIKHSLLSPRPVPGLAKPSEPYCPPETYCTVRTLLHDQNPTARPKPTALPKPYCTAKTLLLDQNPTARPKRTARPKPYWRAKALLEAQSPTGGPEPYSTASSPHAGAGNTTSSSSAAAIHSITSVPSTYTCA